MIEYIPFHKPMSLLGDELVSVISKIADCIDTGILTNNKNVRELENNIKEYYGVDHVVACSSGSQALVISLQALSKHYDLRDRVHTQAFAWYSSMYAIKLCGFVLAYHDIDRDTWNMLVYEDKPKLSMPVHIFGNVSEIESDYLIYDGAHCLGSRIRDFGDITVLSLAPTKIVTSIEGGLILTDNDVLAVLVKNIRDKVSRMSEIHAIFGNAYFSHIDEFMKFKKEVFDYYRNNLDGVFQKTAYSTNHNTIAMLTDLKIPNYIETRKYYEPLIKSVSGGLENTEYVYRKIVCLPSWFGVDYKEVVRLINEFNK